MRILPVVFTICALLGGCSDRLLFAPAQNFSAPGLCGTLAQQRLNDARMMGLADGYEKTIFDNAHRDCLAREAGDRR